MTRPKRLPGKTHRFDFPGCNGRLYVTINERDGQPFEIFLNYGRPTTCTATFAEALARMVSLALAEGIEKEKIIKQLIGITCPYPSIICPGEEEYLSCADALAKALKAEDKK